MPAYELLITADEVISLAFPRNTGVTCVQVPDTVILSSQEKFIKPVLNGLYPVLLQGKYPGLLDKYVKPALAYFVKFSVIPHLAYSYGDLGVTMLKSPTLDACSADELSAVRKAVKAEAAAILKRAVEYIQSDAAGFPEYDPAENILNRVGISSQFIL